MKSFLGLSILAVTIIGNPKVLDAKGIPSRPLSSAAVLDADSIEAFCPRHEKEVLRLEGIELGIYAEQIVPHGTDPYEHHIGIDWFRREVDELPFLQRYSMNFSRVARQFSLLDETEEMCGGVGQVRTSW
jgi:hypothetical protein